MEHTLTFKGTLEQFQKDIATLGSILDPQLSGESGKFQLAGWSHICLGNICSVSLPNILEFCAVPTL